tara:strand:+ start:1182 stop:1358 length:177 start_codon:yes stop_codon:yes gene_type:complete
MKKDIESICTGLILGLFLYFLGAIDFQNPISYILILAIGIIIIIPAFNIIRRKINKSS